MNPRRSSGLGALLKLNGRVNIYGQRRRGSFGGRHRRVYLNPNEPQQVYYIYAEKKKNGAGHWGAQTSKQQPTRCRSKTGADASALCHFHCAKERLKTAKKTFPSKGCSHFR